MRVFRTFVALCAGALVVAIPAGASAKPIVHEHYEETESDTFTDTECGAPITIDYSAEFSGVFKLQVKKATAPIPLFSDNYSGVERYTNVANGKTVTLLHQGLFKDVHVELVEGTIYRFTAMESGRPVVAIGPDGKKLIFDRGRLRYTALIETFGDGDSDNDVFLGVERIRRRSASHLRRSRRLLRRPRRDPLAAGGAGRDHSHGRPSVAFR